MSGKYEEIFRSNESLFYKNSPIVLEAYGLYKDLTNGRIICQLKFKNIGNNTIKACKVLIDEYEIDGTSLNKPTEYSFLDLNCGSNENFGSKIPIYLNSLNARIINIRLINIVLNNYEVINLKDSIPENIIEQKEYKDYYDLEKTITFKEIVGQSAKYVPVKTDNYFLCTCGTVNSLYAKFCSYCGLEINELINMSKDEYLQNETYKRKERETKEKERIMMEIEEQKIEEQEKERMDKLSGKIAIITLVIIIFSMFFYGFLK